MRISLLLLVMLALAGAGCHKEKPVPVPNTEVRVSTVAVEPRDVRDVVQSVGTVEALDEAVLSSKIMGVISELRVEEGERVRKGEVLVVIDAEDIKAKRAEAEHARDEGVAGLEEAKAARAEAGAALENARINFERMEALYAEQAVTKKELDDMTTHHHMAAAKVEQVDAKIKQVDAKIKQSDAGIRQAGVMLGYAVIKSPMDGVVVAKMAHRGEMAAPGMPLLKVLDDRKLRLSATVKESGAGALRRGDNVTVVVDALGGKEIEGTISEVVPAADPATRSFTVRVALPATTGLLPGMFGRAYLSVGTRRAVVIPDGALVDREGMAGVYVVAGDGLIRFQPVTIGDNMDGGSEALSGLSGGEKVVVGASTDVREGMRAVIK